MPLSTRANSEALLRAATLWVEPVRLLAVNAQVLHKAGEECGFEVRVALAWLPHGGVFFTVGINFFHAFVGEEDVGRTVFTLFDANDELVAFAGRVDTAQADFVQQTGAGCLEGFWLGFQPTRFPFGRWPVLQI